MRMKNRATIEDLRRAVDCLPQVTKVAMLEGIGSNEIIVGAYSDGQGICPMLAAHRAGGRTSLISFARAWDRFAFRDGRSTAVRRASDRELRILAAHLHASLLDDATPASGLAKAIAEHVELLARREAAAQRRDAGTEREPASTQVQACSGRGNGRRGRRNLAGARGVRRTRAAILSM